MKSLKIKIFILFFLVNTCLFTLAQSPQKVSYQSVIRDVSGDLVRSETVGMQISILQGSASGTAVYVETHSPTTNVNGLASVEVGNGTLVSGTFSAIDWSDGPYFLKVETDPSGGNSYTISGTTEILSVPYALFANKADSITNPTWEKSGNTISYNNGFVGIGTSNPQAPLELINNVGGSPLDMSCPASASYVHNRGFGDTWNYAGYSLQDFTSGKSWSLFHRSNESRQNHLDFNYFDGTNYYDFLSITPSGNVGIGSSNPSSKLEVDGEINVRNNNVVNVADPVEPQDAATKAYVDLLLKEIEFLKRLTGVSSFTDARDGNVYSYITIDTMEWMAENLAYLPSVDSVAHESFTDPHYYVYDYDGDSVEEAQATDNYETYGVLYNWAAAETACLSGWHLPDETEWSALIDYLIASGYNYDGSTSGNYVAKSMATATGWSGSSTVGAVGNTDYPDKRNKSGFSALPGGYRGTGGSFNNMPGWASWWSSEYSSERAYAVFFGSSYTGPNYGGNWNKLQGMSVRCVRD